MVITFFVNLSIEKIQINTIACIKYNRKFPSHLSGRILHF